ncbi:MAG: transpeptidase family protein [Acidobacteria bacterium]|nr:transpeptidase family protein [Acidobacteriota bacterium]
MPRVLRIRLILLCFCVALAAAAIGVRLYTLQVKHHARFLARATEQHQGEFTLPSRRGALLDRHGRTLAVSLKTRSLYAHPRRVENAEAAAGILAGKIAMSRTDIVAQLNSNKSFVYLHRFLEPKTAREVEKLGRGSESHPALLALGRGKPFGFEPETKRFYPRGRVASHVIGFADWDGNGVAGAENRFNDTLQGDPKAYLVLKDARDGSLRQLVREPAKQSSDVRLTLDLSLQHLLERELDDAMRRTGAKAATSVMLDPRTGQVLAMANRPTIDRSDRRNRRVRSDARANRAIEHFFEPGSTFKIVPMALAIENGTVDLGERIYCHDGKPYHTSYGREINDVGKNGMLTPRMIIAKSSNIGMVKINRRLDSETLREGILRFGFGQRSGIELPAESPGTFAAVTKWSAFTHDSLAFGQEIGATALQMASAMATIANDGVRVEPRIGLGTQDAKGVVTLFGPAPSHRVVSPRTAQAVRAMLEDVIEKGSGRAARLPGYRVAGKSGTAQKKAATSKGYSESDFIASFVGFAPASDPALVVLVALDSPRGTRRQGGEIAAPVFRRILAEALQYLRVPKDAEPPLNARLPPMGRKVASGAPERITLTPGRVPDVRQRTLREAIATLSAHGYRVRVEGSGKVVSQSPAPGTALAPGGVCDLRARTG